MNFVDFLKTHFQQNSSGQLLLDQIYFLKFETNFFQFKATSFSLQFEVLTNLCKKETIKQLNSEKQVLIDQLRSSFCYVA